MTGPGDVDIPARPGPVASAPPQPARARPGHRAPRVEGGHLPDLGGDINDAIRQCDDLFRIERFPYQDIIWTRNRPFLKVAVYKLRNILRADPDDEAARLLSMTIQHWLEGRGRIA